MSAPLRITPQEEQNIRDHIDSALMSVDERDALLSLVNAISQARADGHRFLHFTINGERAARSSIIEIVP